MDGRFAFGQLQRGGCHKSLISLRMVTSLRLRSLTRTLMTLRPLSTTFPLVPLVRKALKARLVLMVLLVLVAWRLG